MKAHIDSVIGILKEKLRNYKNAKDFSKWLDENYERIELFIREKAPSVIFKGVDNAQAWKSSLINKDMYRVITTVAVINACLASLPGKMGVGVFVSMGLEAVMAITIARSVGVEIKKPSDIFSYFALLAGVSVVILFGFVHILRAVFSIASSVPGNPLVMAEIVATNAIGVMFIIGFREVKEGRSFTVPFRLCKSIGSEVMALTRFQWEALKQILSPSNIKRIYKEFMEFIEGDGLPEPRQARGDIFAHLAMLHLVNGSHAQLEGPMAGVFIQAIRQRWSAQFDETSSLEDMATKFREYDADALQGATNTIKGKMFEILATNAENEDGDDWTAKMHADESFPGSDIIFSNPETGEKIDVSLKAASIENKDLIENALLKYPDIPVMTTDEMASLYGEDGRVFGSGFSHEQLQDITTANVQELISKIEPISATEVVFNGQAIGTIALLWPFTMAYLRKRITKEQYSDAAIATLGQGGQKLAAKVIAGSVLGPIYIWYLLGAGLNSLVDVVWEDKK
ncbi:MAG: hypothetical protein ACNYPG_00760 [Candidatus Porifericomitaceae bacterium WSBS_2022_MAG_OTU9]